MAYTELQLAQVDRRIAAVERCVTRQRESLKQHIDTGVSTETPLQELAQIEALLLELRCNRNEIRNDIAAANTKELLSLLTSFRPSMPVQHASSNSHAPSNSIVELATENSER